MHHGTQRAGGNELAEAQAHAVLDELELASAEPSQDAQHDPARDAVAAAAQPVARRALQRVAGLATAARALTPTPPVRRAPGAVGAGIARAAQAQPQRVRRRCA